MKRRLCVRVFALVYAAIIVAGCAMSIGLTNSPTLPSGPTDPIKKN